ncbi:acylphosphatase [Oceanobacillus picturae]|uniref:Acylphosphatase n=1 Tax=Oceanobacillus picturae TaxID=171693 RepID=A0A0U9H432_9BACI|nr:acylphosphatase [Oceanobacillus picturae]GAQ17390.1 acylphosphatase [Oceanobacillus picturae]
MRKHLTISGRVQGVGFRNSAQMKAKEMNLYGWVQNNDDGTVELEVEGKEEQLNSYIQQLDEGLNKFINVEHMEIETMEDYGYDSFQTR